MKISIIPSSSQYAVEVNISRPTDDLDIHEVVRMIASALIAYSFSPSTVCEGFQYYLDEENYDSDGGGTAADAVSEKDND